MSDLRSRILANLFDALIGIEAVNGGVDDVPWDYASPPLPRPGCGTCRHPFVYLFEGQESPNPDGFHAFYMCDLPFTIECTYEYSQTDGANGLKPVGRQLLADIQRAIMVDPNRGGVAQVTTETLNAVEETPIEGVGIVVLQGFCTYVRALRDPDSQDGT